MKLMERCLLALWNVWNILDLCCVSIFSQAIILCIFTRDSCTGRYCWECVLAMIPTSMTLNDIEPPKYGF